MPPCQCAAVGDTCAKLGHACCREAAPHRSCVLEISHRRLGSNTCQSTMGLKSGLKLSRLLGIPESKVMGGLEIPIRLYFERFGFPTNLNTYHGVSYIIT